MAKSRREKRLKKRKKGENSKISFIKKIRTAKLSQMEILIYFVVTIILTSIIAFFTTNYYKTGKLLPEFSSGNSSTSQPKATSDNQVIRNIDFVLSGNGFNQKVVNIKVLTEYNFRITKQSDSSCQAIRNANLGYVINLNKTLTNFPVIAPITGEFKFECVGQNAEILVKVE